MKALAKSVARDKGVTWLIPLVGEVSSWVLEIRSWREVRKREKIF
jgi:hypothetical protein